MDYFDRINEIREKLETLEANRESFKAKPHKDSKHFKGIQETVSDEEDTVSTHR